MEIISNFKFIIGQGLFFCLWMEKQIIVETERQAAHVLKGNKLYGFFRRKTAFFLRRNPIQSGIQVS